MSSCKSTTSIIKLSLKNFQFSCYESVLGGNVLAGIKRVFVNGFPYVMGMASNMILFVNAVNYVINTDHFCAMYLYFE